MGGSVTVYLRNTVKYTTRSDLIDGSIKALCIETQKPNSKLYAIPACYRPSDSSTESFPNFELLIRTTANENKRTAGFR